MFWKVLTCVWESSGSVSGQNSDDFRTRLITPFHLFGYKICTPASRGAGGATKFSTPDSGGAGEVLPRFYLDLPRFYLGLT